MEPMAERSRPMAFVIRVQQHGTGMRGQVITVATGVTQMFDDLHEAMAFIKDQIKIDEEAETRED